MRIDINVLRVESFFYDLCYKKNNCFRFFQWNSAVMGLFLD